MDDRTMRRIREIIDGMQCPKDFRCAASGFEALCMARDRGLDSFLVCLEDSGEFCSFRVRYGDAYYCSCPLRVYLARQLGKRD
jgi:hypothetical protein